MAPFTRGQATKATATEVTALAAYSASEIGRQARERDAAIAQAAQTYVVMLSTLMDDGDVVVRLGGKSQVVTPDDLRGDFSFFAQDSGSTPMSDSVKKQELTNLVPLLQSLGVSNDTILKSLVRAYDLPEDFLPEAAPPMPPVAPTGAPTPGGAQPPNPMAAMAAPNPANIAPLLPPGGVV
jgi:hypothetical protein